jgi:hypothetical protein
VKICIPSHKRAATISTHRLVSNAVVCVPESQREDYAKALDSGAAIVTHPDSVIGLTPKLNWMLANLDDGDSIVFLDDDLEYLCRCFCDPSEAAKRKVTDPAMIEAIIAQTAAVAAGCGAYFFGWETSESTIQYYSGLQPFRLSGFINGCAMGFRSGHGLRFDERIVAKNDYDIACLNAFRHRICLRDTRYAFSQRDTFTGAGGQSCRRSSVTEQTDADLLLAKYGGNVIKLGKQGGKRKRDYAGVVKVTLSLPF